jgi:hypothetical protein
LRWGHAYMHEGLRGPFLTSPLGANLDPRGEVVPQGWICPLGGEVIPWGWNSLFTPPLFETIKSVHLWGWTKGWTSPLGDKVHP